MVPGRAAPIGTPIAYRDLQLDVESGAKIPMKMPRGWRLDGWRVAAGVLTSILVAACASGSVPSPRPDAAVTLDCHQSFERAYPDRSRLPPYHRLQELDVRPNRRSGPMLQYPEGLRSLGITGTVEWAFLILPTGRTDYAVVSRTSHRGFVVPARDFILGTLFRPGEVDGRPVATLVCWTIGFSIVRNPSD